MCNVHYQQHPDKISLGFFIIYLHSLIFSVGVGTETKRAKKERILDMHQTVAHKEKCTEAAVY